MSTPATFKITLHSGFRAPADAIDQLWQRLGGNRDGTRFARAGTWINASWEDDSPSMERDERAAIGRRAVLDIVCEVCDRTPGLQSDWFAVRPLG